MLHVSLVCNFEFEGLTSKVAPEYAEIVTLASDFFLDHKCNQPSAG